MKQFKLVLSWECEKIAHQQNKVFSFLQRQKSLYSIVQQYIIGKKMVA